MVLFPHLLVHRNLVSVTMCASGFHDTRCFEASRYILKCKEPAPNLDCAAGFWFLDPYLSPVFSACGFARYFLPYAARVRRSAGCAWGLLQPAPGSRRARRARADSVAVAAADARVAYLEAERRRTAYAKSQCAEFRSFIAFTEAARHGVLPSLLELTGEDVRRYLAHRELSGGRTVVHVLGCPDLTTVGARSCSCPSRMKFASLRVLMHKLKAALLEAGVDPHANPVDSREVTMFLKSVRCEQARAGVPTKQALPLSERKLQLLSSHLLLQSQRSPLPLAELLQLKQDRAWILLSTAAAQRNGQMGELLVSSVSYADSLDDSGGGVDRSALLLGYWWGKTIRDGRTHTVRVEADRGAVTCPVSAVEAWVASARAAGWNMDEGYLFSPIRSPLGSRLPGPGSAPRLGLRFTKYLQAMRVWDGETLHSTRSGGTVMRLQAGAPAEAVNSHVGWAVAPSPEGACFPMLEHYSGRAAVSGALGIPASRFSSISPEAYERVSRRPSLNAADRRSFML